ncbi:MAG: DNA primase [Acidobacteriota bacterium]|nr:DNA primase [Acidobacteriota bacterium]
MDFLEQVKSSVDIVKVVGEYVRLKKAGGSPSYKGLCPFHNEKSPSFSVHSTHQFYKCFGCGAGGDVLKFVMEMERVSFFDALKMLAERNGIPVPKRNEYSDPQSKLRASLIEMHESANRLFQSNLKSPQGAAARAYLAKRGVSDAQIAEFGLGLSADSWDQLCRRFEQDHIPPAQLEQSGLVMKRQEGGGFYDRFRGRLMFPIHNEAGKPIGFGGRALKAGDEPKYLNSPETDTYLKSYVLYNLHRAKDAIRKLDRAVLVEGYMDVIGVYSAGVQNVVASCGTALTNTQVRSIKRFSEKIVVNFDPDAAGANAAERSLQMLLDENMRVRVLQLEGGLDPDEYVKQAGADTYRAKLESAAGYFEWLSDRARKKFDMRTAEGRIAGLQFLMPAIQRVSDRLERATIAGEVAGYLGIERGLVLDQFRRAATDRREPAPQHRPIETHALEKLLLNALLVSADAREQVLPRLLELEITGPFATRNILVAMSSLDARVEGPASAFAALEARLSETDRDLLAKVVFADELGEESRALDQAVECLRTLENQNRDLHRTGLRDRIKSAERTGNMPEALRLMQQLNELSSKRL